MLRAVGAIHTYATRPAVYVEYDSASPEVAQHAGRLIEHAAPGTMAEHIGSTAAPGCAGKGIIDLMVLYPPGQLDLARDAIDVMGFQRQQTGHAFPEDRPMRVGAIHYDGKEYRLHVHIISADDPEVESLRAFRDALRSDRVMRNAYQARKRAILQSGVSDPADYTQAKSEFITAFMNGRSASSA